MMFSLLLLFVKQSISPHPFCTHRNISSFLLFSCPRIFSIASQLDANGGFGKGVGLGKVVMELHIPPEPTHGKRNKNQRLMQEV